MTEHKVPRSGGLGLHLCLSLGQRIVWGSASGGLFCPDLTGGSPGGSLPPRPPWPGWHVRLQLGVENKPPCRHHGAVYLEEFDPQGGIWKDGLWYEQEVRNRHRKESGSPHGAVSTKGPFDPELYFGKMEKFWR